MRDFDGQGKSFLCNRLAKDFSAELIHVSAPKTNNAFLEYVQLLNNIIPDKNYVFDRCFHGELAYGPVYRNKSMVNDDQLHYLEIMAMRNHVECIYCWTDLKNTKEVFNTRGETSTLFEDVQNLNIKFNEIIEKSTLLWSRYDWRNDSYADMVSRFWVNISKTQSKENKK